MTSITIDRAVVEQALHVATVAGYPVALIAALRAALADQQEPGFWGRVSARQASRINRLEATAQQALEAMRCAVPTGKITLTDWMKANRDLEAALAEPVQEPYCYVYEYDSPHGLHREFYPREYNGMKPTRTVPVYTAPPQRPAEPVQEQAEPEPPPEAQTEAEKMAYCAGWWDALAKARKAEPMRGPQGCDHCNHPLYAATKCRVCGRVTEVVQDPDSPERRCGGPGCDMRCCQPVQEPMKLWPLAPLTGYYDVGGKRVWLEKDEPFPQPAPPQRPAEPVQEPE